jgi:hypothetical protein
MEVAYPSQPAAAKGHTTKLVAFCCGYYFGMRLFGKAIFHSRMVKKLI